MIDEAMSLCLAMSCVLFPSPPKDEGTCGQISDLKWFSSYRFDLQTLPVDFVECLMRFLPTEAEVKLLRQYERERQPLEELAAEDRFMLLFSKVERLTQRMAGMAFLGNFQDNLQMLTPVQPFP